MEVIEKYPPNYKEIENVFPVLKEKDNVVFTYGDALFNPNKVPISDDLDVHERTHALRQKEIGINVWWDKYLSDVEFRLEEEILAYKMQYKFCVKNMTNKEAKKHLEFFAASLSSDLYGDLINYHKAFTIIRKGTL